MASAAARTTLPFTQADIDQTIPARFEAVARAYGERLALTGDGRRWTYDALNRDANQMAHLIRARTRPGVGCVAYLLDHSPDMIVAALGVLKAGKTCLAIHPGMPDSAMGAIVKDVSPELVLTRDAFVARARAVAAEACDVLTLEEIGASAATENPHPITQPDDLSLIFYTSGTTGQPKGVVWSHRRMLHRVWVSTMYEATTPADRQTLLTHCSFANSQIDVFGALLQGAALCVFDVVPKGLTAFSDWLEQEQITLVRTPATLLRRFLTTMDPDQRFSRIRAVSVGGEFSVTDIERWRHHFLPPCKLFLRFSSTETAVIAVASFDHDTALGSNAATAGSPVVDRELTIVDDQGQPVPTGDEGELVVHSAFLADGYWRHPDDTARAFATDPRDANRRSYRTGDRGRLLPDGRFEFLGRRDEQVKIRGYRVEVREVETAVRRLGEVSEAAVIAVKEGDEQRLLAFVVARAGTACDLSALRTHLGAHLPDWKIPARFCALESLPMTLSGKVDRQRLREHALHAGTEPLSGAEASGGEGPRDALEVGIAERWREVLRTALVSRSDDFFAFGGDSLQATVLHLHLERLAGVRIPLEALFKHPTVEGMARVIREIQQAGSTGASGTSALPPVLIPFRKTGSHVPLFLVHGRMGRAVVRPQFLEILGVDQPVYGLQAAGLDRTKVPDNTIAEMAREYVRAMKYVQPDGPYLLGAACAGGVVAIEMANQLRRSGESVAPLLLFDPPAIPLSDRSPWRRYALALGARLRKRFPRHPLNRTASLLRRRDPGRGDLDSAASLDTAVQAALDFKLAGLKHRGWHYDGKVLLLRSQIRLKLDGPRGGRGTFTKHLTGDVRWFEAGATHNEVVGGRSELAVRQIRQCVDIARQALDTLSRGTGGARE